LFLIVANRVILFLYCIQKNIPSGLGPIYSILLCGTLIPVMFPPMFYMGERFKECEGDLFSVEKIVNREITF
jgi:fucose permease